MLMLKNNNEINLEYVMQYKMLPLLWFMYNLRHFSYLMLPGKSPKEEFEEITYIWDNLMTE